MFMNDQVLAEHRVGHWVLQAVCGDLTRMPVDAIVNAANCHLAHDGGLAGAIVASGGHVIQEESDALAPIPVGSAVVTTAGALPARHVIHAVGPQWGEGDEETKLRSAVRASLDRANELAVVSLALPAISTGIFGYPKQDGTRLIVEELLAWLGEHPACSLRAISLAANDLKTAELFEDALCELAPPGHPRTSPQR